MKRLLVATLVAGTILATRAALADVPIAADPRQEETLAGIASNATHLVAIVRDGAGNCQAYRSNNAGKAWSKLVLVRTNVTGWHACDADIAATPNGRFTVAYSELIDPDGYYKRIWVTHSEDNGLTWSAPVIALEGDHWFGFTSPTLTASKDGWLYVTGIVDHDLGSTTGVGFARSPDGQTWFETGTDIGGLLVYGNVDIDPVTGINVAAGNGGEVLAVIRQYTVDQCGYFIKVMRSVDHGATFGPPVVAASAQGCYRSLQFPDVKIGNKGTAHIVYTRRDWGVDEGNIEYTWSAPPYTTWAAPVTVSDDGLARTQTNPSLSTQTCGKTTILHVVWEDDRLTPVGSPDYYWNVFYSSKVAKNGAAWSKNVRVSSKPVIAQYSAGMSPDVVATKGKAFVAWTNSGDVLGRGIGNPLSCR